jgi:hypothetical protein
MIDEAQASRLLHAAGADLVVDPPRADSVIAARWRARRRRVVGTVGTAAAVGLVIGGVTVLGLHGGSPSLPPTQVGPHHTMINTWPRPSGLMLGAEVGGRLEVSRQGCLILRFDGHIKDLVWPYGFTADTGPNGTVVVKNQAGRPVVREGQVFHAAGGSIPNVHGLVCRADPTRGDVISVDGMIQLGE